MMVREILTDVYKRQVLAAAKGSNLKVAAQNTYFENAGAFTGETSP